MALLMRNAWGAIDEKALKQAGTVHNQINHSEIFKIIILKKFCGGMPLGQHAMHTKK